MASSAPARRSASPAGDQLNEETLIAAIRAIVEDERAGRSAPTARIALGIGDDAAVWQPSRSHRSVITSDALVDGVHFLSEAMLPGAVGHRAMAANLSDVAAMGARPLLATVVLGVAPHASEAWILDCYRGMQALALAHDTRIVGGDIVRSPALTLSITLVGEVSPARVKRRDGGRPGDVLALTGPLGASRAGLELTRRSLDLDEAARAAARKAFDYPQPRIREGRRLAASANVHAMMDCSDGLSTDVARLARASGCGATLENVPIDSAAQAVATAAGDSPLDYALNGGEDFELLVAIAPRAFAHLSRRFEQHFKRPLLRAGRLDLEPGLRLFASGETREIHPAGYDHLA